MKSLIISVLLPLVLGASVAAGAAASASGNDLSFAFRKLPQTLNILSQSVYRNEASLYQTAQQQAQANIGNDLALHYILLTMAPVIDSNDSQYFRGPVRLSLEESRKHYQRLLGQQNLRDFASSSAQRGKLIEISFAFARTAWFNLKPFQKTAEDLANWHAVQDLFENQIQSHHDFLFNLKKTNYQGLLQKLFENEVPAAVILFESQIAFFNSLLLET
jgi:hypothetical protein